MASSSTLKPELFRFSSILPSPLEYFTDSSNIINTKCDVILLVGNDKFYCHRLLLSLVSPVFARMFDGQFKEHDEREIILEGKSSESILELLKYIYPQFNGQITNANVDDFIKLADEYMIDHLKQPCKDVLLKQLQLFKFVQFPTQQKLEQQSVRSKSFRSSDPALNASSNNDDNSSNHVISATRRAMPSSRHHSSTKPTSTHLKPGDKSGSSSNSQPRYFISLDKTRLPMFYDENQKSVPFSDNDVEIWIRRLRILYQIDKGRNYGEVIDRILSVLQFIPTNLLLPLAHVSTDTFAIDEIILNDIGRARMCFLEEWTTDGNSYRAVNLTEAYQTMSPSALIAAKETPNVTVKVTDTDVNAFQPTVIPMSDNTETDATNDLDDDDDDDD